ncbi:hypothetical protein [Myroides injenensis]|uniref:hypothetical protein n=1 Tax=Myroides injenensis TaxID=1183151 RepID=UPI000287D97E|nr:hypothetical protein [Myroides injenensis]
MKRIVTLFLIIYAVVSCNTDDKVDPPNAFVDLAFSFRMQNKSGEDLLNPMNENAYKHENIRLFYIINETQKMNLGLESNDKLIDSYNEGGKEIYHINIRQLHQTTDINRMEVYLSLSKSEVDKIEMEVIRPDNNTIRKSKIWYNGELVWDVNENNGNLTIEK